MEEKQTSADQSDLKNPRGILSVFILPVLFFFVAGCPGGSVDRKAEEVGISGGEIMEAPPAPQPVPGPVSAYGYDVLNLGEVPWDKEEKLRKFHKRFLQYLGRQLGIEVILNICPDYGTLQKDIEAGNVQIASFTPGAYADALIAIPGKTNYVATLKWHGTYYYKGYIFARKDTPIDTIGQMKDKTIAFTDKGSSSGFKYPVSLFLGKGIYPDTYFSRIFFLGSHRGVLQGVLDGNVHIGATYDRAYKEFEALHNSPFKIIVQTPEIPFGVFAVASGVPQELFLKIRRALVNLDKNTILDDGAPVLEGDYYLSGFVVKDNSLYDFSVQTSKLITRYLGERKNDTKSNEKKDLKLNHEKKDLKLNHEKKDLKLNHEKRQRTHQAPIDTNPGHEGT
ncbi:MAG: phosphate/phosphite/phosphonate ABC transporter substrate-binding protein [bacterium]|nr:phosphate/phosphite/phosphonate ABC transporter substrate-binding protein [bacterium]